MKKFIFALTAMTLAFACASAPADEPMDEEPSVEIKFLEHSYSAFGGNPPDWVTMTPRQIENTADYEDMLVFRAESSGQDKDGALLSASRQNAQVEVARMISLRVQEKYAGAQIGDTDLLETYMEQVVKSLAEAEFSGLRNEDNFWAHVQITDENDMVTKEYRVWTLFSIPENIVQTKIQEVLSGVDANSGAANEEERTARARVREIMNEGI